MKKILKIFVIVLSLIVITGCGKKGITEIKFSDLEKSLNNNKTFILEIVQDGCSNCEAFTPKFNRILKKNGLSSKQINLTNLTEEEKNKLDSLYNITGTPTVIFIEKGKEKAITNRIIGNVSEERVITKLKKVGYIK